MRINKMIAMIAVAVVVVAAAAILDHTKFGKGNAPFVRSLLYNNLPKGTENVR